MSIRLERWMRNLVHGRHGRWVMLGLLIAILAGFTVMSEIGDWLQGLFRGTSTVTREDFAGRFAVLPGETTEVSYAQFESARFRYQKAQLFLGLGSPDQVRDTEVWTHLLLLEAAKKEGVRVSSDELKAVMSQGVPEFIFNDEAQYRSWVPENYRVSAPQLETAVLEYLTAWRMRELYRESFVIAPATTRKTAIEQAVNQNVEFGFGDYAALDAVRFLPEAEAALKAEADPDAKLRDFFDKDPSVKLDDRFRHPRRYRLELLYTIHSNVNDDAALKRIQDLVRKAYPEAKFKEVTVGDRRTYFGIYRDRLLAMVGTTWDEVTKDVREKEARKDEPLDAPKDGEPPAPPSGQGGEEPLKQEGTKPEDQKPEGEKPDEPKGDESKGDESKGDESKPEEPKPEEPKPEEPKPEEPKPEEPKPEEPKPEEPKPEEPLDPDLRKVVIEHGYQLAKFQIGREVDLRSVYEFLYLQTKDNVSLKEIYDRLKAHDDPQNPVCATEPDEALIVYRDFGGKALSGAEIEAIEDSAVKFGFSFKSRVTKLGVTDLPKMSGKADTLGDAGHGRQIFRLLEVILEQRKTFEELTDGEKEELRRVFYLPERARELAKGKLEALRNGLTSGEIKPEQFRAEAEKLGCRVHEGEWIEATHDFLDEPDRKSLWPDEYLHMRDRYFLRKSIALARQEWNPPCFLPVDVEVRRGGEDPGAAYLFHLRERKRPDESTIPSGEIATYIKHYESQRRREEAARWTEDWEKLRSQFRMSFEKEMQTRIDEELRQEAEARRKGSP